MPDVPRSSQFDDVYFSVSDGLAETRHVFLYGNDLPAAWAERKTFTIFEAGFGTGLNFLATWKAFDESKKVGQKLDFISIEKYPLTPDFIKNALGHWRDELGDKLDTLCDQYPPLINGYHRLQITHDVTLTLIFADINEVMPTLNARVDAWFLDGFTPSKNPDMWTDVLFENMARLSNKNASVATFTAAGDVRRALEEAGFNVQKIKGYGRKREMITGVFKSTTTKVDSITQPIQQNNKSVAIIGAGLAGCAMGYVLQSYGFKVTLYEREGQVASGASGNNLGFYNPRFTAQRDEVADFFSFGFSQILSLGRAHGEAFNFDPCGALHLINSPEKEKRFNKMLASWGWDKSQMQIVDSKTASEIAGVEISHDCLYLPQSGSISPRKLCDFYARDLDIKYKTNVINVSDVTEDIKIICTAFEVDNFEGFSWLPMEPVRGQISYLKPTEKSKNLKCNLHYNGYLSRAINGQHSCGSTFQRWLNHRDLLSQDHDANLDKIMESIPSLANEQFDVESGWAGLRTASQDRFPIVGKMPDRENIYISSAFGSYGIVGTLAAGHYMADILRGGAICLPEKTQYALSAQHFLDRIKKKSGQSWQT